MIYKIIDYNCMQLIKVLRPLIAKYSDIESKDFLDPLQYQMPKNGFRRFCFEMGEIVKWSEEEDDRILKINLICEWFLNLHFNVEIVFSH